MVYGDKRPYLVTVIVPYQGFIDDCYRNGRPDECDPYCNGNGIPDACDVADETSPDCNANLVPD